MVDDEEVLTGGHMDPVVRVGDTVRRVAGEWTPAVHRLLDVLAGAKITQIPRAMGVDERGREVLSYLPGRQLTNAPPDVLWSERVLVQAAQLLRRIHDASEPLVHEGSLSWRAPIREPVEVVCHNDFATYNLIERDGVLVGAIDFDYASPGPRLWDLAYLAYRIVPYVEDAYGAQDLDRDDRLSTLINAYGTSASPAAVRACMADRLDDLRAFTLKIARRTGRRELLEHAAMYGRDAVRLRDPAVAEDIR
jgi:Ser/Thr protein kinase RdoA (MazF antagonist)